MDYISNADARDATKSLPTWLENMCHERTHVFHTSGDTSRERIFFTRRNDITNLFIHDCHDEDFYFYISTGSIFRQIKLSDDGFLVKTPEGVEQVDKPDTVPFLKIKIKVLLAENLRLAHLLADNNIAIRKDE